MKPLVIATITAAILATAQGATAQMSQGSMQHDHMHQGGMAHGTMSMDDGLGMQAQTTGITEPGQSAFGAIAEIVAVLEADPETDWSTVNIRALRAHLVDMDRVTLWSDVAMQKTETGATFTITGEGDTVGAIQRMSHAHAGMMQGDWQYEVEDLNNGVTMAVTAPQADLPKLYALGFFGIMASGMHHQIHHFMLATGNNPHQN